MKRLRNTLLVLMGVLLVGPVMAQPDGDYPDEVYVDRIRVDRYLDAEVWVDHLDGDYYVGEAVDISYRVNRDAFVAIYSVDSRGRVNLLYPTHPGEDNFAYAGVTYDFPSQEHDFDLVVGGPEGVENIQIIASREKFPVPEWYEVSGLVCDWDDRFDFMDYVNAHYFVRYDGQRFAFDRTALYVNEWEPDYFRPVYRPYYPSWTVCGNVYIDYPWGASIYIDGVYWGCTPLYVPRVYVGWHTFTVYNHWGHCWESDIHVTRYHTVVLDHEIVRPASTVMSKYKEVRSVGYRDPVSNGYPKFKERRDLASGSGPSAARSKQTVTSKSKTTTTTVSTSKKYVRGSEKMVKTNRGYETAGVGAGESKRNSSVSTRTDYNRDRLGSRKKSTVGAGSGGEKRYSTSGAQSRKSTSGASGYKSGKTIQKKSVSSGKSIKSYKKKSTGSSSSRKSGTVKPQTTKKSGGSSGKVKTSQPKVGNSGAQSKSKSGGSTSKKSTSSKKKR